MHETIDTPGFPQAMAGDSVVLFVALDSETSTDGTLDLIDARRDPGSPGGLLIDLR